MKIVRVIARLNIGGPAYHVSLLSGRLDPERYALDSDRVPATYGEFLFRSFTPRWREPAATERAAGAQVRSVAFRDASKRQTRH